MLTDWLASFPRERAVLVAALESGIPAELAAGRTDLTRATLKLLADHPYTEEVARWAVEAWKEVLQAAVVQSPTRVVGPRVTVAIDFGTARSGFAYGYRGETEVHVFNAWPDAPTTTYPKTLTQLLFNHKREVIAWGYSAPAVLAHKRTSRFHGSYRLLRDFKMQIRKGTPGPDGPKFSEDGEVYSVVELIATYLAHLRLLIAEELGAGMLTPQDIHWCLTVPAIWSEADKQLMRRAIERAGVVEGSGGQGRLTIVLEPEAAAVYCRTRVPGLNALPTRTRLMIVDAGGGTVDLTVHEITSAGLREVVPGSGGACGSTYIDREFLRRFEEAIGSPLMTALREEQPVAFHELLNDWELLKCSFRGTETSTLYLKFPNGLKRLLKEPLYQAQVQALALRQNGDKSCWHVSPKMLRDIFEPILAEVVQLIRKQFDALPGGNADYLCLVGGFSESRLLQDRIQTAFASRVQKVVVPPHPGRAVVEGAVLYGLHEAHIQARRARLSYGCAIQDQFRDGQDPPAKKEWNPHRNRFDCTDRFSLFVAAGDLVPVDSPVVQTYYPLVPDQTFMVLRFFATSNPKPEHTDEPGTNPVGELTVLMPDITGGLSRAVTVTMYFGRTEIQVDAHDQTSGKRFNTSLTFHDDLGH